MNLRLFGGEADVPGSRNDTNRRTDVHKKATISLNLTQLKTWSCSGRIARRRTDIATGTSLEDLTHALVERDLDWCL